MININLPKDTLKYVGAVAVIFGSWLGAYVWGIHLGAQQAEQSHKQELAECVVKVDQVHTQMVDAQLKLVECESIKAGKCALNCEAIAQERVDAVLQDLQEVMCAD